MDVEGDTKQAIVAVEKLASAACTRSGLIIRFSLPKPPQLEALEDDLQHSMDTLKGKNRIFGTPLSIDELLDPCEERENLDTATQIFADDAAIVAEVHHRAAVRSGAIVEVDSDSDDVDTAKPSMATSELITLAEKLEAGYVSRAGVDSSPDLLNHLRAFRAQLRCEQMKGAKQTTLNSHGFRAL